MMLRLRQKCFGISTIPEGSDLYHEKIRRNHFIHIYIYRAAQRTHVTSVSLARNTYELAPYYLVQQFQNRFFFSFICSDKEIHEAKADSICCSACDKRHYRFFYTLSNKKPDSA